MKPLAITFDVYGTLTQWDETVRDVLHELLARHDRADADIELAAHALEAESRRLQTVGAFRSYRDILRESLIPALATSGLKPSQADEIRLLQALACIRPFPDVPDTLRRLGCDYRLAPISNTDDDLLADTIGQFGGVFATTVTAEQAMAYKPNPGLFRFALDKLGVDRSEIVHVAQGTFSDLAVCTALGIRVIWVNRNRMTLQQGLEPIATIGDLSALPEQIGALS